MGSCGNWEFMQRVEDSKRRLEQKYDAMDAQGRPTADRPKHFALWSKERQREFREVKNNKTLKRWL